MTKAAALAATGAVALLLAILPPAAQASSVKVDQDEVCVVSTHADGGKGHYLLTKRIVTQLDDSGQPVGPPSADHWKRWPRRDYRHKWERYCGPDAQLS
jgi:hypothetical protein